jgi:hypothetical protein
MGFMPRRWRKIDVDRDPLPRRFAIYRRFARFSRRAGPTIHIRKTQGAETPEDCSSCLTVIRRTLLLHRLESTKLEPGTRVSVLR